MHPKTIRNNIILTKSHIQTQIVNTQHNPNNAFLITTPQQKSPTITYDPTEYLRAKGHRPQIHKPLFHIGKRTPQPATICFSLERTARTSPPQRIPGSIRYATLSGCFWTLGSADLPGPFTSTLISVCGRIRVLLAVRSVTARTKHPWLGRVDRSAFGHKGPGSHKGSQFGKKTYRLPCQGETIGAGPY